MPRSLSARILALAWLLPTLAVPPLVFGVGPPQATDAEPQTLVFGHILASGTAHHRHLLWAAAEIERVTDGRYRLQVFPEGQLGTTDAQVIEGFKDGTRDLAYLSLGHLLKVYPPLAIGAGPFVFRDFDHWQRFAASDLYRELAADMEARCGLVSFGLAYYGARHVTTREPLAGPAGLKGLVIRVPNMPTMILTFRALGAKPVPIPFKETYQAIADGVVDAQENPLPAIQVMRFYEVTPVINATAHILDAQILVMDGARWARIAPPDQERLRGVFAATAARVTQDVRAEELALAETLKTQGARFNPIDRAPLIATLRPLHHSDYFPWGGALYDRIQALAP